MGLAPMQGGPLHSDGSGSSEASSECAVYIETPFSAQAKEKTSLACGGVVVVAVARWFAETSVVGNRRQTTT